MALQADSLQDMRIDSDRQIILGGDGDWEKTSGLETVEQSVGILASSVVRPLIGTQVDGQTLEDIQSELQGILSDDPQIENVQRVEVKEIDLKTYTVKVDVFVGIDNTFDLDIDI